MLLKLKISQKRFSIFFKCKSLLYKARKGKKLTNISDIDLLYFYKQIEIDVWTVLHDGMSWK